VSTLPHEAIHLRLADFEGWHLAGNAIERTFDRADFDGSIRFVNQVAAAANAAGHHPDIRISWNRVTVTLSSHDAGGVTERDFALARKIDTLAANA
jgi:4a-hydroxytetrahydrobiopterin dehydratase